jgi:hypothetical protein
MHSKILAAAAGDEICAPPCCSTTSIHLAGDPNHNAWPWVWLYHLT